MIFSTIVLLISAAIPTQTYIHQEQQYVANFIDVEWNVTSTNNLEMFFEITRPQRGVSALSGTFEVTSDADTDKTDLSVNIHYSPNGITYTRSPLRYPSSTMTDGLNSVYKNYFMDSVGECCENPIHFEGTFISPLRKQRMVCSNCLFVADNLPTHMREGFYKIEILSKGELGFVLVLLARLEFN